MRATTPPQSATSLPRAPRDDSGLRMRNYVITMSVRTTCFILMVAVTPYGWYTWVFAAGAALLPYIAVVIANVGVSGKEVAAVDPGRALDAPAPTSPPPTDDSGTPAPNVIRIQESPPQGPPPTSRPQPSADTAAPADPTEA